MAVTLTNNKEIKDFNTSVKSINTEIRKLQINLIASDMFDLLIDYQKAQLEYDYNSIKRLIETLEDLVKENNELPEETQEQLVRLIEEAKKEAEAEDEPDIDCLSDCNSDCSGDSDSGWEEIVTEVVTEEEAEELKEVVKEAATVVVERGVEIPEVAPAPPAPTPVPDDTGKSPEQVVNEILDGLTERGEGTKLTYEVDVPDPNNPFAWIRDIIVETALTKSGANKEETGLVYENLRNSALEEAAEVIRNGGSAEEAVKAYTDTITVTVPNAIDLIPTEESITAINQDIDSIIEAAHQVEDARGEAEGAANPETGEDITGGCVSDGEEPGCTSDGCGSDCGGDCSSDCGGDCSSDGCGSDGCDCGSDCASDGCSSDGCGSDGECTSDGCSSDGCSSDGCSSDGCGSDCASDGCSSDCSADCSTDCSADCGGDYCDCGCDDSICGSDGA